MYCALRIKISPFFYLGTVKRSWTHWYFYCLHTTTKKSSQYSEAKMGDQFLILRADCFCQLIPGFRFGCDVKTLKC